MPFVPVIETVYAKRIMEVDTRERQSLLKLVFMFLGSLILAAGCASTSETPSSDAQALSGTDEQVFIGDSIEMNYDPNVIMKRAESYFEKESYAEALVEYQHFLDLHRQHILAPYAQYKIGMSHIKMFKSIDRDPAPIEQAMKAFQTLRAEFPGSRYDTEARIQIRLCRELLAQHHLFVGKFYYRRESYLAAAHRLEKVVHIYPESKTSSEAMLYLARTYRTLGADQWAASWLAQLLDRFPDSPHREDALTLLADMQVDNPDVLIVVRRSMRAANGQGPSSKEPSVRVAQANGGSASQAIPVSSRPRHSSPAYQNGDGVGAPHRKTVAPQDDDSATCPLGTWCDSSEASSSHPSPSENGAAPPSVTVCKLGQWC
ncbi:MAG: outer membrane protein assembly factor BamD [Nitrospirae bacterium]|nr:MAG: outer membrane protein assembly factor BamD [Nitrospirota bacterium]